MKTSDPKFIATIVTGVVGLLGVAAYTFIANSREEASERQAENAARKGSASRAHADRAVEGRAQCQRRQATDRGRRATARTDRAGLDACYGHIARLDRQVQRQRPDRELCRTLKTKRRELVALAAQPRGKMVSQVVERLNHQRLGPGHKHNNVRPRRRDIGDHERVDKAAGSRAPTMQNEVSLVVSGIGNLPVRMRSHRNGPGAPRFVGAVVGAACRPRAAQAPATGRWLRGSRQEATHGLQVRQASGRAVPSLRADSVTRPASACCRFDLPPL